MIPELRDGAVAVLLGLALGTGLWSMLAALPRWAAPRLSDRIAPYIRDVTDAAGTTLLPRRMIDPGQGIVAVIRGAALAVRDRVVRLLGGTAALAERLSRAAWDLTVDAYRGRQLTVMLIAAALGAVGAVIAARTSGAGAAAFTLPVATAFLAYIGVEMWLTRAIARRRARIEDELPTVLDFLALCLSAGEGLAEALRRTSSIGTGALAGELRRAVRDTGTGTPLVDALSSLSERVGVPAVSRAVDQLVAAVERGAPLAAVLRDQAADARDEHRRALLEASGKKEIAMLFPLVFLILPLSVLLAVYPGIHIMRMGLG